MFTHNGKISVRQVTMLLVLQMFNMTILILPKMAADFVGRNGYILPIVALIFGVIYVWCITGLTKNFPGDTLVEFTPKVVPRFVAYIIVIAFAIKLIVTTGLELRMFGEMITQVMLPKTPLVVIMLVMLLSTAYLVKSGMEATARMGEILVYFVFVPLGIVFCKILISADYKQVMPFFQTNLAQVGRGSYYISLSFMPIEFMLMMTGLMEKPKKARRAAFRAILIIAILETLIILLTICSIGIGEVDRQIWPVLTLMQSIENAGRIIENQEIFMMTGWILSIFMYISSGLYFTSLIGSRSFRFKRENVFVLPLVPIVYFIAVWPTSLIQTYDYYIKFQRCFGAWFLIPVPLLLWLIAKVRRVGYEH